MKNKYNFQKNQLFILILVISIAYFVVIGVLVTNISESCILQLMKFLDFQISSNTFSLLSSTSDFFVNIIATITLLLLLIKIGFGFLSTIYEYIATKRYVYSLSIKNEDEYNLVKTNKNLAFTYGLFKPQIYISKGLIKKVSKKEFEAVVKHENHHKISLDPLGRVVSTFLKKALPYFPGKNSLFETYNVLTELAADESYIRSTNSKIPLVSLIYKLMLKEKLDYSGILQFSNSVGRVDVLVGKSRINILKLVFHGSCSLLIVFFVLISFNTFDPLKKCERFDLCHSNMLKSGVEEFSEVSNFCADITKTQTNYSPQKDLFDLLP